MKYTGLTSRGMDCIISIVGASTTLQNELKVKGDWVDYIRALDDIAQHRFQREATSMGDPITKDTKLFYDEIPCPNGVDRNL